MTKKKKKMIRLTIVIVALVLVAAVVFVVYGNRDAETVQYNYENYDEMDFDPFVANEERLDNSFLEYGKVLTKYASKGYKYYSGDPISVDVAALIAKSHTDTANKITALKEKYGVSGVDEKDYTAEGLKDYLTDSRLRDFLSQYKELTESEVFLLNEIEEYKNGVKYTDKSDNSEKSLSLEDIAGALYVSNEGTKLEFDITVDEAGLYSLYIEYLMLAGRDTDMLVNFTIDGKLPFEDASNMALKRMYGFYDYDYAANKDVVGNQIRPKTQEIYDWQETVMSNPDGLYRNPYRFYLQKGSHKIALTFSKESGAVRNIKFIAPVVNPSYAEYKTQKGFSDSAIYTGTSIKKEMEVPDWTTSISVRMETDNDYYTTSNATLPSYKATLFNIFGGDRWSVGGDKVEWTFNVPETGWYELGFRYKSQFTYVSSFKEIKIDGSIPFAEMEEYCFPYADGWTAVSLLDADQNPYLFYLEEGDHTISLVNKVGPLRHSLQRIEESMDSISTLVNKIVKITASARTSSGGYTIDKNRDYDLQLYIPTIQEDIKTYMAVFDKCYEDIIYLNGGKVTSYASAVKVAGDLFEDFDEDLEKVAISLNDITNAQTGLSNTMVSIKEQPIAIDYMVAAPKDYDYPDARSNAWQSLYVGAVRFLNSFDNEKYENAGAREGLDTEGMPEIEVYVARGREHVDIMRNMVSEQFTPEYGIKVNINMVAGSSEGLIMPRYVAGTAPDLAISIGKGSVFEFAIRGALAPLNEVCVDEYNGIDVMTFDELWKNTDNPYGIQSYHDEAFVPFNYLGDYYAFPETQNWNALFYRTDIFDTLGVEPPQTWDEVYDILPTLTNSGYDFCFNYGVGGFTPLLYQYGGDFYTPDAMQSALNTELAYDAFMEYSNLYLQYNFVYAANFYMRFKSGEMPIGIADLTFYQQLYYSAPELNGKWAMTLLPGKAHVDEETGEEFIDRSISGVASCCIIIKQDNEEKQHYAESWTFIQWWLSNAVQAEYGREVEATFGVASRWNPANKVALQSLPYSQEELDVINAQWEHLDETPGTMGDYYTSRYLVTALNQTVMQGLSGRIALEDAVKEINKEMRRKQAEFGIPKDGAIYIDRAAAK